MTDIVEKEPDTNQWARITEDDLWKFVTRSITRTIQDVIATHEAHGSQFVPVAWLRDYADDIAFNFPRIQPWMLSKTLKDKEFESS